MKDEHERREEKSNDSLRKSDDLQPANVLALDTERYLPDLVDCDLTEEQANELLRTLWEFMKTFVYLGWGVDSIHHVLPDLAAIASDGSAGELKSEDTDLANRFENAAEQMAAEDERT